MSALNLESYTEVSMQLFENDSCGEFQNWYFQAKSRILRNSSKTACKAQKKRICETAMMCVCSTKRGESLFRVGSLETHFFQKPDWDIPHAHWAYAVMAKISH